MWFTGLKSICSGVQLSPLSPPSSSSIPRTHSSQAPACPVKHILTSLAPGQAITTLLGVCVNPGGSRNLVNSGWEHLPPFASDLFLLAYCLMSSRFIQRGEMGILILNDCSSPSNKVLGFKITPVAAVLFYGYEDSEIRENIQTGFCQRILSEKNGLPAVHMILMQC